jgi:hypothetical protein
MADFATWTANTRSVEHVLHRLDIALSPKGLATFLQGEVDPYLRGRAEQRFSTEGDDVVGQWAPLKPATQNIRAELGYGPDHPINVRTGELMDYITQGNAATQMFPWGAGITLPGQPASGELLEKMIRAQAGDERTVPRPVLGMNENDLIAVLLLLARYIRDSMSI